VPPVPRRRRRRKRIGTWVGAWAVALLALLAATASAGPEPGPPPKWLSEIPDYTGVTVDRFLTEMYRPKNPHGDYMMPAVDPKSALIVDVNSIGGPADDANPGTVAKPFKTIERALRSLKPGGQLLLRRGRYNLTRTLRINRNQSGTAERPTLIAAYPGEKVVLTACLAVKGWTRQGPGPVYAADSPLGTRRVGMVWVNGRMVHNVANLGRLDPEMQRELGRLSPAQIPRAGYFRQVGPRLYVRGPGDADLRRATVEIGPARAAGAVFQARSCRYIVFDRLVFTRCGVPFDLAGARDIVIRHCALYALAGEAVANKRGNSRVTLDHCLLGEPRHRQASDGFHAPVLRFTGPLLVRDCLIRNVRVGTEAFSDRGAFPDRYPGPQFFGNTFLRTGFTLSAYGHDPVIRRNLFVAPRGPACYGRNALVEENFFVYCTQSDREGGNVFAIWAGQAGAKFRRNVVWGPRDGIALFGPGTSPPRSNAGAEVWRRAATLQGTETPGYRNHRQCLRQRGSAPALRPPA